MLFHLTWFGREWASPGVLLTINCFSLEQMFSHTHVFGPALPGKADTSAGLVASRDRNGPHIWALCQTKGKRTADYHWEHRWTENQMAEGTCPTSYGKIANWDTAAIPSLPCPMAVKCLLLPLPKHQGHPTCPPWVWPGYWGSLKPFLHTVLLHTTQLVLCWKTTDFNNTVPVSILSTWQVLALNSYSIDSKWLKKRISEFVSSP